jgi:hypothetical protein
VRVLVVRVRQVVVRVLDRFVGVRVTVLTRDPFFV